MRITIVGVVLVCCLAAAQGTAKKRPTPLDVKLLEVVTTPDACESALWPMDEKEREAKAAAGLIVQTIGELIDSGASANAQYGDGTTALMLAVENNVLCAVDTLLARGADPNLQDRKGMSALLKACGQETSNQMIIHHLLLAKADPNLANKQGTTALMRAVYAKKEAAVNVLVNFGADVNATSKDGGTALRIAKFHKLEAITGILERAGAEK